jgi:hypothetical protein
MLSVVQMGGGGTSGVITGDSDTNGLDNLGVHGSWREKASSLIAQYNTTLITYCTIQHNTDHSILDGNFGSRYQWRC